MGNYEVQVKRKSRSFLFAFTLNGFMISLVDKFTQFHFIVIEENMRDLGWVNAKTIA